MKYVVTLLMKHPFVANANKTGVIQNNVPNSYISTLDIYTGHMHINACVSRYTLSYNPL